MSHDQPATSNKKLLAISHDRSPRMSDSIKVFECINMVAVQPVLGGECSLNCQSCPG